MSFKALRRSRDSKASAISPPLSANPVLSRPPSAKTFTPKKVIRAIDSRKTAHPQELSFSAGDFFYVVKELRLAKWVLANVIKQPNAHSNSVEPGTKPTTR